MRAIFEVQDGEVEMYKEYYQINISEARAIIDYLKGYIKEHKTDERIEYLNMKSDLDRELASRITGRNEKKEILNRNVYLLHDTGCGLYKIGLAKNVDRRVSDFQLSNPTLTLVTSYPGTYRDEKKLHELFSHLSVGREWFRLSEQELNQFHNYFSGVYAA